MPAENNLEARKESNSRPEPRPENTRPEGRPEPRPDIQTGSSGDMGAQQSAFHPALSQIIQNQVRFRSNYYL